MSESNRNLPARRRPNVISDTKKMTGYRFAPREKDPTLQIVIARIVDLVISKGLSPEYIERETTKIGRKVSASAIIGWLYGDVRRPQNYTMESVMLALGVRREWIVIESGFALEQPKSAMVVPARKKAKTVSLPAPEAEAKLSSVPPRAKKAKPTRVRQSKPSEPFSYDRQDVIDRIFGLSKEGKTLPMIASVIAKEFSTQVKPSSVKEVLTFKKPTPVEVAQ